MQILAVDDDDMSLSLLQQCLQQGGYEDNTLLSNPTEILATLENKATPFECILLDVEMPELSGIDLCGEIRKIAKYRNTPILMITKRSDTATIQQAFDKGATDYITKPFRFIEILARIKVAELLVQERKAATDSYKFERLHQFRSNDPTISDSRVKYERNGMLTEGAIVRECFISLDGLGDFLDEATKDKECAVSLVAIKIRKIDEIFAQTKAWEFLRFLDLTAGLVIAEVGDEDAFISHLGHGTFICTSKQVKKFSPRNIEKALIRRTREALHPLFNDLEIKPEFLVGTPLILNSVLNLNFKRAIKATVARVEHKERGLSTF